MSLNISQYITKSNKLNLYLTFLLIFLSALALVLCPIMLKLIVDELASEKRELVILWHFLFFSAFYVINRFGVEYKFYIFSKWEYTIFSDFLNFLFVKIFKNDYEFFKKNTPGFLSSIIIQAAQGLRIFLFNLILHFVPFLLEFFFITASLFYFIDFEISFFIAIGFVLYLILTVLNNNKLSLYQKDIREKQANLQGDLTEILRSWKDIHNFQAEQFAQKLFGARCDKFCESNYIFFKQRSFLGMVQALILLGVIIFSNYYIIFFEKSNLAGNLILINGYIMQLIKPLEQFGLLYRNLYAALSDWRQILKFIPNQHVIKTAKVNLEKINSIEFRNIKHEKNTNDINLHINYGEKIALIGKTGAGKTSILDMLIGLKKPKAGKIFINGKEIEDYHIQDIQQHIGYLAKDAHFLPCNLHDNISLDRENKSPIFDEYRKITYLDNLVKHINLSSGESQIIQGGRIFYCYKDVLIFDESFSSIDVKLVKDIIDNIILQHKGIVIYVTHRSEEIKDFDRVVRI